MPRRTMADARRALEEEVIPRVSDHWANEYRTFLESAESVARKQADEFFERREGEILGVREEALKSLTEVRDEYDALQSGIGTGLLPARDATLSLRSLRRRQEEAEALLGRAEHEVERLEELESDGGIAWMDDVMQRSGQLREFPW